MKTIELTRGYVAVVDDADYEWLNSYSWCRHRGLHTMYAIRGEGTTDGRTKSTLMHRQIISAPHGQIVDHINGNGLDNRRQNLRFASKRQNCQNQPNRICLGPSGFRGVKWDPNSGRWQARIRDGEPLLNEKRSKRRSLGYFNSAEEAARAYDAAAISSFGEFATLNFGDT